MGKKEKILSTCILACFICAAGFRIYSKNNQKNFCLSEAEWDGDAKFWTENNKINGYDIKFTEFDGTAVEDVISKKSDYNIKINTSVKKGKLNIKVYNDNKVLLDKDGSIDDKISISKEESKNLKIEFSGDNAESGHISFKIS